MQAGCVLRKGSGGLGFRPGDNPTARPPAGPFPPASESLHAHAARPPAGPPPVEPAASCAVPRFHDRDICYSHQCAERRSQRPERQNRGSGAWDRPVRYFGSFDERQAVRRPVGLFRVSRRDEIKIRGPQPRSSQPSDPRCRPALPDRRLLRQHYGPQGHSRQFFAVRRRLQSGKDSPHVQSINRLEAGLELADSRYTGLASQGPKGRAAFQKWRGSLGKVTHTVGRDIPVLPPLLASLNGMPNQV